MAGGKFFQRIDYLRKIGGFKLIRAYSQLGILGVVINDCIKGLVMKQSAQEIYSTIQYRVDKILREKYKPDMLEGLENYEGKSLTSERSNIVWICWLQGMDNAPTLVRLCLESLRKNLLHKEIVIIDEANRRQFVILPDFIEKRWAKKQIPPALFADLLRLELLIKYGGTWIDSTVLCTGKNYLAEILDTDLFFFQFKKEKQAKYAGISNWFITSCQNNPILLTLRDMLYAYWKDFDCVLEYYIFHRLFDVIAEERPEIISMMPYAYSPNSLALIHNWEKNFKQETWDKLTSEVSFHKLSYKVNDSVANNESNYYNYVMKAYSQ